MRRPVEQLEELLPRTDFHVLPPKILIPPDQPINSLTNSRKEQRTAGSLERDRGSSDQNVKNEVRAGCYISGSGDLRTFIDILSLVLVLYCTVLVPYDMAFNPPKGLVMRCIDIGIEVFFICEMTCNFFTSYLLDDGTEVTQPSRMAHKYAKSWFLIDACSSVPAETATMIAEAIAAQAEEGGGGDVSALTQLKIIRMMRLAKLLRLAKIARILEDIEFNYPTLILYIGLFKLCSIMLLVAHFNACMFFWMGKMNMGNSWISKYNFGCCDTSVSLFNQQDYGANGTSCFDPSLLPAEDVFYVNSIYWSITTLTTIGYGDITPCNEMEMLYTALSHLLGSALFAYVVGGIATVAMTKNGQEVIKKEKQQQLQEYLEMRQVPREMRVKIQRQNNRKWNKMVFDEEELMESFTAHMKRKVIHHIKEDLLKGIPLIRNNPDIDFQIDLVCAFKPLSIVIAGDQSKEPEIILDFNDGTHEMYVLLSGEVELFLKDGKNENGVYIDNLKSEKDDKDLHCFNELGMLSKEPSVERVLAISSTPVCLDFLQLRRTDFDKVMCNYTSASRIYIEDRIEKERARLNDDLLKTSGDFLNERRGADPDIVELPERLKLTSARKSSLAASIPSLSIPETSDRESMNSAKYFGATPGRTSTPVELDDMKKLLQGIMQKQEWFVASLHGIINDAPRRDSPQAPRSMLSVGQYGSSSLPMGSTGSPYLSDPSSPPILLNISSAHWV